MSRYAEVSADPVVQAHYESCRRQGTSHSLALMFAERCPPMSNTDREFLEGRVNGNQFEGQEWVGDLYKKKAEAAGVSTTGKVYIAGLASEPGDPRAWVSGRGDVQAVCEERGWNCTGSVLVKGREHEVEKIALGEDIVAEGVQELQQQCGGELRHEDAVEKVKAKKTPHWKKKRG